MVSTFMTLLINLYGYIDNGCEDVKAEERWIYILWSIFMDGLTLQMISTCARPLHRVSEMCAARRPTELWRLLCADTKEANAEIARIISIYSSRRRNLPYVELRDTGEDALCCCSSKALCSEWFHCRSYAPTLYAQIQHELHTTASCYTHSLKAKATHNIYQHYRHRGGGVRCILATEKTTLRCVSPVQRFHSRIRGFPIPPSRRPSHS